ncbi:GntR family transcriptional regulator [Saccharopolyspora spinosa]|uniref:GntR family transcriptional regulator n=1 Tax=Saccharopolyspora spinosa TaxID=60894 RepID=A0A2N3Y6F7_SACSN|nr:GntR family transcriptional regulator [Saccharopolyspora spinosa]PKW18514.1 GntR family transcriptional regulator [Saccharopolyspora spinosa]
MTDDLDARGVSGRNYRGRLGIVGVPATSQSDAAYDAIKTDIVQCVIPPRARLTEAELADRYKLGRASIRVALNRLYQEALVDVLPRYGYVVAGDDELGTRDLYQLQLVLEPTTARLAAGRVDAKQLLDLDARCRDAKTVRTLDDATRFLHANTNFHAAVALASGNALMTRFVRILFERLERQIYASGKAVEIVTNVAHTHEELVELLIEGNDDAAEAVARQQLADNHQIITETMTGRRRSSPKEA